MAIKHLTINDQHRWPRLRLAALLLLALPVSNSKAIDREGDAVTPDGGRIHYRIVGEGVPVVCIPGGPGGASDRLYGPLSVLKDSCQLILIDNRGRGRSQNTKDAHHAYSLENDVKDVEAVRVDLGEARIAVLGHSYGSMVAMAYASTHPDKTLALMTSAGVHGARAWQTRNIDTVKRLLRLHYPDRWERINQLRDAGHTTGDAEVRELFDDLDELYIYNPRGNRVGNGPDESGGESTGRDTIGGAFSLDVYLAMVGPDPEWAVGGSLKGIELLPQLSRYRGPALVMGGRHDRICPPINQQEIAAALSNAKLAIFEESGHSPFREEPERFKNIVTTFVKSIDQIRKTQRTSD